MAGTPGKPDGIYELDWDGSANAPTLPPKHWWPQQAQEGRISIAQRPDPVRHGNYAVRFELHKNDRFNQAARSELSSGATDAPKDAPLEMWYGFSVYLQDWATDPAADIVTQWHHDSDAHSPNPDNGSPPLAIMTQNGQWAISERDFAVAENETINTPVGAYEANCWTDWVVHVKWSGSDDAGELTIWKDGVTVEGISPKTNQRVKFNQKKGQNCFARFGNYTKIGIYKWPWHQANSNPPSNQQQRVMFHDELRIANKNGSYALVAPPINAIK